MNRLWNYEDYINHLSHRNRMVRRWAFRTIENHYPNRYTDEVCNLIGDEDEHDDFSTKIMFEARSIVRARYSEDTPPAWLDELHAQDTISLTLLEDLSKRSSIWKRINNSKELGSNLIALILSVYIAIKERDAYLAALSPGAGVEDLIRALMNAGPSLPKSIQKKIKQGEPISELKNALTRDLMTWGDIWTVRMMGRIGNKDFVPDLIRVLKKSDSMDYIYSYAIRAMNALEKSADEIILAAIKNKELGDWESFPILEYLPYSEAYDLALQR